MNRKLQEDFEMGRMPIKPLPYKNKDIAQQGELMIDYVGEDPTYHIFIVDSGDPTKIYDLTSKIITENVSGYININIDGQDDPLSLHDLINLFYKNFIQKDNPLGFDKVKDINKVLALDTKRILFKDANNNIVLPITSADAVYDDQGRSLQDRLRNISRVSFMNDYVKVTDDNQSVIDITYPFNNYMDNGNFLELRIGTTYIDKSRYQIVDNRDSEGNAYGATITFFNDKFEKGRRIDLLYIYNAYDINNNVSAIDGKHIIPNSIPFTKLEKVSDRYTMPDSSSIASSKALYDMYLDLTDLFDKAQGRAVFVKEIFQLSNDIIEVDLQKEAIIVDDRFFILNVLTQAYKQSVSTLRLIYLDKDTGEVTNKELPLVIPGSIGANRVLRILVNINEAICLSKSNLRLETHKFIHPSDNDETIISFKGLEYNTDCIIRVYREGKRLFQDVDYRLSMEMENITLYTPTEAGEKIIFEAEYIVE